MLLKKGANINIKGKRFGTALQAASTKGYKEIIEILLEKGADINIKGGNFGTALQAASAKGPRRLLRYF